MIIRATMLLVLVAVATGCADNTSDASKPVVTDSAGVRIVTSPSTDQPLAWTFEESGFLADSSGEPYIFTAVHPWMMTVSSAGHVYALDRVGGVLNHFDENLAHVGDIGRKGGGPGELNFPLMLTIKADTLMAFDAGNSGMVRWDTAGKPLSTIRMEEIRSRVAAVGGELWYEKRGGDDSTVDHVLTRESAPDAPVVRVVNKRGPPVDFKCVRMSGSEEVFAPTLNWTAAGNRVASNGEAAYVVNVHENGKLAASFRRDIATRAPTEDDVKLLYPNGFQVKFGGGGECTAPVSEVMKQFGVASTLPLVHDLRMLGDGTIFVRRAPRGADSTQYDVIDSTGAYVGTTDFAVLHSMPNGDVLVERKDDDSGGFTVRRMRIVRQ